MYAIQKDMDQNKTYKYKEVHFINIIILLHAAGIDYNKFVTLLLRVQCYTVEKANVTHLQCCEPHLRL